MASPRRIGAPDAKNRAVLLDTAELFGASTNGATRTRIRKATGLDREQVGAALGAAKMSGTARETAQAFGYAITLDQLALLAEFDGDEEAVERLTTAFCDGKSGEHVAERIRQERAELAEHERLAEQLRADGYAITTELPPNATMLHDGQELTPEAHAACPGRGVCFGPYSPLQPRHYCTDPEANGHAPATSPRRCPTSATRTPALASAPTPGPARGAGQGPTPGGSW